MVADRNSEILNLVVREYIKSAMPVSSAQISNQIQNKLSPASVRNIFSELTEMDYIRQPFTSGGRIPTSKGYRSYVDYMLLHEPKTYTVPHEIEYIFEEGVEADELMESLIEYMSKRYRVMGGVLNENERPKFLGFKRLFSLPEFSDIDMVKEFGVFLDDLDEYFNAYSELLNGAPFKVLIGDDNPQRDISNISVIISHGSDRSLIFAAGPTRLNYEKIINLMKKWQTMI